MNRYSSENSITSRRLEGKVAVITGGANGLGECSARLFVKNGAKVVIADIQDEVGHSLCRQLGSEDNVSYIHCDVTNDSDVKNAVDFAVSKYGKLDIMFNNAGVVGSMDPRILATQNDEFKRVFEINMFGCFLGAKHAARVMIPQNRGCILFTSSVASVIGLGATYPYVASKHAVVGFAKNLCAELGQYGIRVNCISPFLVVTPLVQKSNCMADGDEAAKNAMENVISSAGNLKGAVLKPEDIANAALYLASDEAKYVSGMNLVVDGGYSVVNPSVTMGLQKLPSNTM